MTKGGTNSLAYRVWNQTRLAHHVDSYFQIYDEIASTRANNGALPHPADGAVVWMFHALYQTMIVHLDMIKASQGVSLYALIGEAFDQGKVDRRTADRLHGEIDQHVTTLRNVGRQRNNLVAHRSPKHTFAEVRSQFPVSIDDLRALVKTYYDVAADLYSLVPFQNIWKKTDERAGARAMISALRASLK